jgi:hypothetical protein
MMGKVVGLVKGGKSIVIEGLADSPLSKPSPGFIPIFLFPTPYSPVLIL